MMKSCINSTAFTHGRAFLILFAIVFISFIFIPAAHAEEETDLSASAKDLINMPSIVSALPNTQLAKLNAEYKKYGSFTCEGMTLENYNKMLSQEWLKVEVEKTQKDVSVDLNALYSYADIENVMKDLASNNGVELTIIGASIGGRNIYSLAIDFNPNENKKIVLYTGSVHAREGAGAMFILKQFCDLVQKSKTDPAVMELLQKVTFIAIPVVNPDGREMILSGGNDRRKSNANGVDLNRNFPAFNASQLVKKVRQSRYYSKKPSLSYFAGYSLGSENETQAVMKWLNTYVPKASVLIDYHQQAHQVYGGKPWDTKQRESAYKAFAKSLLGVINSGNKKGKYAYQPEVKNYGLNGVGGTITDYAVSVALGLQFSEKFGRMVLNENGTEKPLLQMKDIDKYASLVAPINPNIRVATYEICSGAKTLGFGQTARTFMAQEYTKYHFDLLSVYIAQYALSN